MLNELVKLRSSGKRRGKLTMKLEIPVNDHLVNRSSRPQGNPERIIADLKLLQGFLNMIEIDLCEFTSYFSC